MPKYFPLYVQDVCIERVVSDSVGGGNDVARSPSRTDAGVLLL